MYSELGPKIFKRPLLNYFRRLNLFIKYVIKNKQNKLNNIFNLSNYISYLEIV